MVVRSYRRVFDLERRIYRLDRLRLNPGGIPVRGIAYFLAMVASALLAARLPLIALVARAVPVYVRDLLMPALLAALLAVLRIEGRPFHLAVRAVLRAGSSPVVVVGLRRTVREKSRRWHPEPLLMISDGSDPRARRARYRGPGAVLVSVSCEREVRRGPLIALGLRARLTLREVPGTERPTSGEVIVLSGATRLRVE